MRTLPAHYCGDIPANDLMNKCIIETKRATEAVNNYNVKPITSYLLFQHHSQTWVGPPPKVQIGVKCHPLINIEIGAVSITQLTFSNSIPRMFRRNGTKIRMHNSFENLRWLNTQLSLISVTRGSRLHLYL